MADLTQLYQSVILDHNRNPRNFRSMGDADRSAEGYNPLCGDRLKVWLRLNGDLVEDVSFEAEDRKGEAVTIDAAYVRERLAILAGDSDLSKYIL